MSESEKKYELKELGVTRSHCMLCGLGGSEYSASDTVALLFAWQAVGREQAPKELISVCVKCTEDGKWNLVRDWLEEHGGVVDYYSLDQQMRSPITWRHRDHDLDRKHLQKDEWGHALDRLVHEREAKGREVEGDVDLIARHLGELDESLPETYKFQLDALEIISTTSVADEVYYHDVLVFRRANNMTSHFRSGEWEDRIPALVEEAGERYVWQRREEIYQQQHQLMDAFGLSDEDVKREIQAEEERS